MTPGRRNKIAAAPARVRRHVWAQLPGGIPASKVAGTDLADVIVLEIDATSVIAHSEKENAAATFKRSFGYHPIGFGATTPVSSSPPSCRQATPTSPQDPGVMALGNRDRRGLREHRRHPATGPSAPDITTRKTAARQRQPARRHTRSHSTHGRTRPHGSDTIPTAVMKGRGLGAAGSLASGAATAAGPCGTVFSE